MLSKAEQVKLEIPFTDKGFMYRLWEIIPGTLSYLVVIVPLVIGFYSADSASFIILMFMLIWFFRTLTMSYKALNAFKKKGKMEKEDWLTLLDQDYYKPKQSLKTLELSNKKSAVVRFRIASLHKFLQSKDGTLEPKDLYHVVMIPIVKESYDVVLGAVKAAARQQYDTKNKVILQLCPEARAREFNKSTVDRLAKEFKTRFKAVIITEHPSGLPDELIGKGGNVDYAGRKLLKELKALKINPQNVMITGMDADCKMEDYYLAHLSYTYLVNFKRDQASYQPLAFYTNNIWDAPAPMRILAIGNSFYTLLQSSRPHLQHNFSSHSQSLASLIQTNFWSKRTIVEDGHQKWRGYMAFKGQYRVESILVANYQDAVLGATYRQTLKAQFTQLKRWAYGVSDLPYIFTRGLFGKNKIKGVPFWSTLVRFLRHLENDISWAAAPILLAIGAWLPIIFARDSDLSIVAHQLPSVARWIQTLTMVGILSSVYVAYRITPPRPEHHKKHRTLYMVLQWVLVPVTGLIYGSTTGYYSQTRLMLGKYLDKFEVTEKHRKS